MKKIIAFLLSLSFTLSGHAATSATLVLSGVMPSLLNISVLGVNGNDSLDLTTSQTDLVVGQVTATSNTNSGYKVYIKSLNSGNLKSDAGNQLAYTGKFNGQSISLTSVETLALTAAPGTSGGVYNFAISYTADSSLQSGTYNDSVVFTIQPN